jgi:hypothetical protein
MEAFDSSYTDEELAGITRLLEDTGYAYDRQQNIFYSTPNPWQRKYGFCSLYDAWATPLGMVYDCEPVRFEYNGKRWLIELWKGQYGITVGGEIGIYNTAGPDIHIPGIFKGPYYRSAGDDEALDMAYTLFRNGEALFTRAERHWWLTGFILGECFEPSSLTMEAALTFGDPEMLNAFVQALRDLGYGDGDIGLDGNTVRIVLAKPRSKQPLARRSPASFLTMLRTRALVEDYKRLTQGSANMYDILVKLREEAPLLYLLAVNMGRRKEQYERFDAIGGSAGQRA